MLSGLIWAAGEIHVVIPEIAGGQAAQRSEALMRRPVLVRGALRLRTARNCGIQIRRIQKNLAPIEYCNTPPLANQQGRSIKTPPTPTRWQGIADPKRRLCVFLAG
jgi:hypothetical protein